MGLTVEALDRGIFERSVHAFDLAIGPRMFRLGQSVVDVGILASYLMSLWGWSSSVRTRLGVLGP